MNDGHNWDLNATVFLRLLQVSLDEIAYSFSVKTKSHMELDMANKADGSNLRFVFQLRTSHGE